MAWWSRTPGELSDATHELLDHPVGCVLLALHRREERAAAVEQIRTAAPDVPILRRDEVKYKLTEAVNKRYEEKERLIGADNMRLNEKYLLLQVIDQQWKDHLLNIDHLKEGIGLRGYGQRDPLIEYKKESFELFQEMMERIQDRVVKVPLEDRGGRGARRRTAGSRSASSAPCPPQPPQAAADVFSGAEGAGRTGEAQAGQSRPQRPLPLRLGKKVQEVPRHRPRKTGSPAWLTRSVAW